MKGKNNNNFNSSAACGICSRVLAAALAALLITGTGGLSAFAAFTSYREQEAASQAVGSYVTTGHGVSPRTEEEWALLEDDTLNWDEIDALIHEYNATVITNRNELTSDERRAMDAREVSEYLIGKAEDYESDAADIEETSATLAATYRSTANSLRQQANSNLDDYEIIKLDYELIEKNLCLSAKEQMIEYYDALSELEFSEYYTAYLETLYNAALNKYSVNMATEIEVLSAEETLNGARASHILLENTASNALMSLIVACGWGYNAHVTVGDLPVPDTVAIKSIDYASDLETAREANLSLRIDEIRLNNARSIGSASDIATAETTFSSDGSAFVINFKAAYDGLIAAVNAYELALTAEANGETDYAALSRRYELGLISLNELKAGEYSLKSLSLSTRSAYYDLLIRETVYDAAVSDGVL